MANSSRIILSKGIKMDREYVNVLNYTETQMLELCINNKVYEADNYSFIRPEKNRISLNVPYGTVLQSNYIAFQNKDYANKWFFAWIDDMIFKGPGVTEITFTVDSWSTWFSKVNIKACWVNREHVNNDTVGANTQSESINIGNSYIANSVIDRTYSHLSVLLSMNYKEADSVQGHYFDKIYNGLKYAILSYPVNVESINSAVNNNKNEIVQITQFPSWIAERQVGGAYQLTNSEEINLPTNTSVDGYVPVNKKLLTFPYKKLKLISTSGGDIDLKPELFNNGKIVIEGGLIPTAYMIMYPKNYEGKEKDFSNILRFDCTVQCSWSDDAYINGIMDKKSNDMLNLISNSVANIGSGVASGISGNVLGVVNSMTSITNGIDDYARERNRSATVHGTSGSNSGDAQTGIFGFYIVEDSIKREYAEKIDKYFTRFRLCSKFIKSS